MMKQTRRRREAGFSLIEAAISGFVVAISVAGLAVSVVYGRQLERSTTNTWRATSAATATLEQIRSDSLSQWSGMQTTWSGQECSESGFGDPIGDKMEATVITDKTQLDSEAGMWNTGATVPNFYLVKIAPNSSGGDLSNALQFQTYVANRSRVGAGSGSGSGGGGGGSGSTPSTAAASLTTTPASILLSNINKTVTFTLTNQSSTPLLLSSVSAAGSDGVKMTNLSVNLTTLYNNKKGTVTVSITNAASFLPTGLGSGPVTVSVTGNGALPSKTVNVAFTFSDNSVATVVVNP